eukprot:TRINITY_DN2170_c0_g1_i11.p3 TRINITY_DN2170_c0_g1~~TRINITY_DN2170_c0_g1_i11.p3  ORF type:complete len:105 (-),score=2.69 TRINITY_DN2170_c0_g1_i11:213-527(-)
MLSCARSPWTQTLTVPGHGEVSKQDAYLRAIAADADNSNAYSCAWYGLGTTIPSGGSVTVPVHGEVSQHGEVSSRMLSCARSPWTQTTRARGTAWARQSPLAGA